MHLISLFHAYPVHHCTACAWVLGGKCRKWSGVWQISKNFGAYGASGKFFSKFRETLIHPTRVVDGGVTVTGVLSRQRGNLITIVSTR